MDSDIFNENIFVLNEVVCSFAVRLEWRVELTNLSLSSLFHSSLPKRICNLLRFLIFSGFFFIFCKNLDRGACQVIYLNGDKLSDFLGLTDIFSVKNVVTN